LPAVFVRVPMFCVFPARLLRLASRSLVLCYSHRRRVPIATRGTYSIVQMPCPYILLPCLDVAHTDAQKSCRAPCPLLCTERVTMVIGSQCRKARPCGASDKTTQIWRCSRRRLVSSSTSLPASHHRLRGGWDGRGKRPSSFSACRWRMCILTCSLTRHCRPLPSPPSEILRPCIQRSREGHTASPDGTDWSPGRFP